MIDSNVCLIHQPGQQPEPSRRAGERLETACRRVRAPVSAHWRHLDPVTAGRRTAARLAAGCLNRDQRWSGCAAFSVVRHHSPSCQHDVSQAEVQEGIAVLTYHLYFCQDDLIVKWECLGQERWRRRHLDENLLRMRLFLIV